MSLSKKHLKAIAVIVAIGLLAAALMLLPKNSAEPGGPAEAGHTEAGHTEAGHAESGHGAPGHNEIGEAHEHALSAVTLDQAQITAAGITLAQAEPAAIAAVTTLPGEIRYNEDRSAHVVPGLAGVVLSVHADLGQTVKRGQLLAVIASSALSELRSELLSAQRRLVLAHTTYEREQRLWRDHISAEQDYLQAQQAMNEADIAVRNARQKLAALGGGAGAVTAAGALNRLELRAPFDGLVMEKHLAPGEVVKDDAKVYTISDLSTVWAEIAVPPKDLNLVRVGRTVTVTAAAFEAQASGKLTYVGALLGEQTRTAKARVALANPDGAWRPGLFVSVALADDQAEAQARPPAAVTVASDALQTVAGKQVVFVRTPSGFQARPVSIGRSDGRRTEIVQGLAAGATYAAGGSFILKAELGKDSAGHDH